MPNELMVVAAGIVAGFLTPFVTQLVKGQFGIKGDWALLTAFCLALLLGGVIALALGVPIPTLNGDPIGFFVKFAELGGVAFALATIIYKKWLEKLDTGLFANK